MSESLKRKTGIAIFWSFVDKGGQQLLQLVFIFILARLINKADFGLVAVLGIFTAIAGILQESGFSSALIRKKHVLPQEYTSVFYFNILISISIYSILFLCAPTIGSYFKKPILEDISRVLFLSFVFNAFGIVQNVHLIKSMNFKMNTRITLLAGIIASAVSIILAYLGFGVWSYVAQIVLLSALRTIFLWIFVKWRPQDKFSFAHIRDMSSYSFKLLLSSLLNQACDKIFPLLIGKNFDMSHAASFEQGKRLTNIPQSIIGDGIKAVAYPLLSNLDHQVESRSKKVFRKVIRISAFISFPIALLIIVLAKPAITFYFPSEWADVIPLLQILAVGSAFLPLYYQISSLLQYKGKSALLLKLEIFRNILLLSSILIAIQYGIPGLATGISIVNILSFFIGIFIAGRTIDYSLKEILMDITPYLAIAIVTILPFIFLQKLGIDNIYLLFVIPLIGGSCLYLLILKILGSVIIQDTIYFVKQSLKKIYA